MNVYLVTGMKRGGQHAITTWICRQHDNITHLNDSRLSLTSLSLWGWGLETRYGDGKDLLANLENYIPTLLDGIDLETIDKFKGANKSYKVLVVRDMRNWAASCFGRRGKSGVLSDPYVHIDAPWRDSQGDMHRAEIDVYAKHLRLMRDPPRDLIVVNYNSWCIDERYRAELARRLGVPFSDAGYEEVSRIGDGSSFDGTGYDGNASEMDVLGRYKRYDNDVGYQQFMRKHDKVLQLSDELFDLGVPRRSPKR